jgi:hypothetical protein
MSIGGTFTQLVLFDGIDIKDPDWSVKVIQLSKIPSSCKLCIFCNEADTDVEKSLKPVKNSQVRLYKVSDPVIRMFDILHENCFIYSFILVVYDKNAHYARNLNKIMKKHKQICVMPMDPYNVSVKDIINKVHSQEVNASEFNHLQSAPTPFSNDDLRQQSESKHDPQTHEDTDQQDHLKKTSNTKKSRLGDQYTNDLYCLVCRKIFHTKDAQNKHIKAGHPDAKLDDDYDYDYDYE